jgi:hypothetical protein
MSRKTKSPKQYHWQAEKLAGENRILSVSREHFDTPEDALADCIKVLPGHVSTGDYLVLIGEPHQQPVGEHDQDLRDILDEQAAHLISSLRAGYGYDVRDPYYGAGGDAAAALWPWAQKYVVHRARTVDPETAQRHVVEVPVQRCSDRAINRIIKAIDHDITEVPNDVREVLTQARARLLELP